MKLTKVKLEGDYQVNDNRWKAKGTGSLDLRLSNRPEYSLLRNSLCTGTAAACCAGSGWRRWCRDAQIQSSITSKVASGRGTCVFSSARHQNGVEAGHIDF